MSDVVQIALWGLASLIPFGLNAWALRGHYHAYVDAAGLSLMLILLWALYNLSLVSPPGQPENMLVLTVLDVIATGICAAAWVTQPKTYKLTLALLFVFQLACHAAFWVAWPQDGLLFNYKAILNATYALQLIVAAWPGGVALVRHCLDRLSDHGRAHHYVGARRR